MECPVCRCPETRKLETKRSAFFRCPRCLFVFRSPDLRPNASAAKERYGLHRNSADDPGYVSFLSSILDRALEVSGPLTRRAVDWGSGPVAVGSALMRERGLDVDSWDPYFAGEAAPPAESYDLAVCIEVAEHFFDPVADFASLAARLKPGGVLSLHTHFAPEYDEDFRSWWYKEDITHVSFYSETALRRLAAVNSLSPLSFERGRLALFRRPLPVLVAGGANWDAEGRPFAPLIRGDSNPGAVRFFAGGTARNVAEDLSALSLAVEFVSAVGDDAAGVEIRSSCARAGVGTAGVATVPGAATSSYLSILDSDGEVSLALSGMALFDGFGPEEALAGAVRAEESARARSAPQPEGTAECPPFSALVVDGNLRPDAIEALLDRYARIPAWLDPVSAPKAARIGAYRNGALIGRFAGMKPNLEEAEALLGFRASGNSPAERGAAAAAALRLRGAGTIYVSLGGDGVAWADGSSDGCLRAPSVPIVSTTGAGDAFLASLVRSAVSGRAGRGEAVRAAAAAAIALGSADACPEGLSGLAVESLADEMREGDVIDER